MNCEKTIQSVEFKNTYCESVLETEVSLPDFCPGIFRVIKLLSQPMIGKLSPREGGMLAEGQVVFTLLYKTENDERIYSYTTTDDFSALLKDIGEDSFASAQSLYSSCKLSGSRRAAFKAVINIKSTQAVTRTALPYCPDNGIISDKKSFFCGEPIINASKRFALSYEYEHKDSPEALLYAEICPIVKETKAVNGRVLIKGEALIRGVYSHADGVLKDMRDKLPFSQVIDAPEAKEGDYCRAFLSIGGYEREYTYAESGCITQMDITLNAYVNVCRKTEQTVCTDCFSADFETEINKAPLTAAVLKESISFSSSLSMPLNIPDGIKALLDISASLNPDSMIFADNKIKISGSAPVRIIYQNADNESAIYEKTLPFECFYNYESSELLSVSGDMRVTSAALAEGDNSITLRIETVNYLYLYSVFSENIITEAHTLPDRPRGIKRAPLSICFAKKGERIWDIAKEFCAVPERIKTLNGIDLDYLNEDKKLLIEQNA